MRTLLQYRFCYFDAMRNKWMTARYVAEREEIEQRYTRYELIEPPEVRQLADDWLYADASRVGAEAARDTP